MVQTPEGLRAIEDIAVGDLVMAFNEETGEIAPHRVTDLIRPDPKPLFALQARDAGGDIETFHATDDHPWRVHGRGWVETENLRVGDRIDTATEDDLVVTSLTLTQRIEPTYNLTVDDWHTFLVGEDQAVVHNANCSPNQLNRQIQRGKAPRGIERIHPAHNPGDVPHAHVNGGALTPDGNWRHAPDAPLNRAQREWLNGNGFRTPD
jgi:hypothetical protein